MSLYNQFLLDTHEKLIVDLFAGGGGASSGIEQALGRMVDIAINHDSAAVSLHEANHPQTKHYVSDVFEIDPRIVCQGRPVGFLWASPDCTFHSKARGRKPIRSATRKRRALAWVVTRWAGTVRPDVIALENVEEFAEWGPLVGPPDALRPCKKRRGQSFKKWVKSLRDLGYSVEWRELRACDYGAPTIRKRLFLIARCDGKPIVWPSPTHGETNSVEVKSGKLKPFRTAAECIDWSFPMLSIFATKEESKQWAKERGMAAPIRPLAENTLRRIARGIKRFVLDNPKPFTVTIAHGEGNGERWGQGFRMNDQPLNTVCTKNAHAIVAPYTVPRYGERAGQEPRSRSLEEPLPTVVTSDNGGNLVAANLGTYYGSSVDLTDLDSPIGTQTTKDRHSLIAANLASYHSDTTGKETRGSLVNEPIDTIDTANRHALVTTFLDQANGGFENRTGRPVDEPISTIVTESRGRGLIAAHLTQNNEGFYAGNEGKPVDQPLPTITGKGANSSLVASHIVRDFGQSVGSQTDEPIGTITASGNGKAGVVASFMSKFYGTNVGSEMTEPVHTISTSHHFGFVTVTIDGQEFYISDIAMRMLQPCELYAAQGFRKGYIIDRGSNGQTITKTEQVRMCGNSVCPPLAEAIAASNVPDMAVRRSKREKVS